MQEEKKPEEKLLNPQICVVGLGYVGLPLAVAFGKIMHVIGFDVDEKKITELKGFNDSSGEINEADLRQADIHYTTDPVDIKQSNFIIVAVPTPVSKNKIPDLKYMRSASEIIGKSLSKDSIIVYESTVYPGVTEEICVPILEKFSGLKCGIDFKVGYSPERINPGDKQHTIEKVIKVVSGMDEDSLDIIADVYSKIVKAGVFRATSIKVAEAAKVIENIQRDLNIALMNELALIFYRIGISTNDVLDAASTKWNFHRYYPGLVGGHCIGVDPYYLTYKAQELGYNSEVILSGRNVNDYMAKHVADMVIKSLIKAGKRVTDTKVLLMGLVFKEDVKDARNSRAKDLIEELKSYNVNVVAFEPLLDSYLVEQKFSVKNYLFDELSGVDCIIVINKHKCFSSITVDNLFSITAPSPILIDIKNMYNPKKAEERGFVYMSL